MKEPPEYFKNIVSIPNFVFLVFIFILSIITYYISFDTLAESTFTYFYFFILITIVIIGFFVSNRFSVKKEDIVLIRSFIFFVGVLLVTLFSLHFYYFFNIIAKSYMVYLLIFFILVTGFTIFYNFLKNFSVPVNSNFFLQFIFYIPCLITDFIQYLGKEYNTTPNVIFILFIFEILFVLLYLYLPQWITAVSKINRIALLENSVFLDKQVIISNSDSFQINKPKSSITNIFNRVPDTSINTNYAITFWVYISSPEKRSETEILNYGNHPRVTYYNNTDNTKFDQDKYIVYFSNTGMESEKSSYKFSAPQQRWNFIAINYNDNGICDLFLNGELIKSVNIGEFLPTYSFSDNVSIGADKGIYGSISNVSYYKSPLTLSQIRTNYNLLMFKNPPVFTS